MEKNTSTKVEELLVLLIKEIQGLAEKEKVADPDQMLDAKDLCAMGFGRNTVYEIFNRADFPRFRCGRKTYVRRSRFEEWLRKIEDSGEVLQVKVEQE